MTGSLAIVSTKIAPVTWGWPPDQERTEEDGLRIWTSRYQNKQIAESGCVAVGIAQGYPRFPLAYDLAGVLKELAPTTALRSLSGTPEFQRLYILLLEKKGITAIAKLLHQIATAQNNDDIVLLCYEDMSKPGEKCHRRMFADWWQFHTGAVVKELKKPSMTDRAKAMSVEQGKALFEQGVLL